MKYVCKCCGSDRIQVRAWIDANTNQVFEWCDDENYHECFCEDCQDITEWKAIEENTNEIAKLIKHKTMYRPEDFNIKNAPKEMVQFVLDNVKDFESRYDHALGVMDRERCPLYHADCSLNDDIYEAMCDWCIANKDSYPEDFDYDIEEIFG